MNPLGFYCIFIFIYGITFLKKQYCCNNKTTGLSSLQVQNDLSLGVLGGPRVRFTSQLISFYKIAGYCNAAVDVREGSLECRRWWHPVPTHFFCNKVCKMVWFTSIESMRTKWFFHRGNPADQRALANVSLICGCLVDLKPSWALRHTESITAIFIQFIPHRQLS